MSKVLQNKKQLFVLLFFILVNALGMRANPVDMRTAREVAIKFVNANAETPLRGVEDLQLVTTYRTESNDAAFHIFNTPNGFVIVSADDCATPILGYSDEGQFDTENIPIQLQDYLQGFVEQIQYGIENHVQDEATSQQWEMVRSMGLLIDQRNTTAVEPLLTDTWSQGCYYNNKCPVDSNGPCGHVYTGCAATSFAQIMHYWGYPTNGMGSHTYTPDGYPEQTANFGATTYDWANMPNSLSSSSSSTQVNAVATLMWHCGVAIDMSYGASGSGASPNFIPWALVNYFGYSNELSIVYREDYSDDEWLALMKTYLDLGCPIHYSGWDVHGYGGHGFVCDGYNASNLLHFNWGWGGSANGYFSINAMNPSSYVFTVDNMAIINIHPTCTSGTTYQITATTDPSIGGTVSGTGTYNCGNVCTLTATANEGYGFKYWTENDELVSTEAIYSFIALNDRNLTAHFAPPFNIVTLVNSIEGGTAIGGGTYYYNQHVTLTAIPNEGYVFDKWTKDGEDFSYLSTLSMNVTEAAEYMAYFEPMDGIVIGEATFTNSYLPIYSFNSLTQQIYTAEEMGGEACEISSVSFFNTGQSKNPDMNIYMVNTNKTAFNGINDWITVTEANLVFSGSVTMAARNWATIYFATPFSYDGSSNVALIVDDNSSIYNYGYINCRTFSTNENQAICINGFITDYDPYTPSAYTGTLMSVKNQVVFGIPSYEYTITPTANPSNNGTVSGGGPCYLNQPVTLTATPNSGYVFSNLTKDGEVVSYLSSYTITVTESAQYVANFQQMDGIVVGNATYTNAYLPTYSNYPYSLSQQIYTVDEMGGEATEISSISLFNTGNAKTRNLSIYMVLTDKSVFESTIDWITVTENDLVFSGNVAFTTHDWTTIYMNTPFAYDGTSNVALIVDDNTGSWNSGLSCRTFSTGGNQAIRITSSSTNYDSYNPTGYTGTLMSMKNQVVFGIPSYDYTVTVSVGPDGGGTVSGGGLCFPNQPITLIATPNEGYVFSNWTKNGTVISYLSNYPLSVTESAEYVAHFQEVVSGFVIGDATYSNVYLPSYNYYSLSEQIYTAAEMGGLATNISSVSFFNTGVYSITRNMNIYMVNTDKTSFESTSDWIPVSENDLVFSGNVAFTARGWVTVYLSTPFNYDGSSNVALIVDDNSNSYNAYTSCRTFSTEGNQTLRIYGSGTDYDPYAPTGYTGTLMSMKNQIIMRWPCTITATANPSVGGTISGSGSHAYGTMCTLTATPNAGYYFLNWTENGSVVSYDASYSFTVDGDRNLVANFIEGESNCNIVFDLYDSGHNGWSENYLVVDYGNGTTEQLTLPSGSSISYSREVATGSTIALSWISGTNTYQCSFDVKFENGVPIYHGASLNANFQQSLNINCAVATAPRTITAVADPEEGGTVDGAGTYESGTTITLTATPNAGYSFIRWMENGTTVSSNANYSFIVSSDRNLVAFFSLPLTVSATTNMASGGTVTGAGVFNYGSTCTLTATPNEGYLFLNWSKNGEVVSCNASYTFAVTEDVDVEAVFLLLEGTFIGQGESTNQYLPSYSYYNYTLSQQIYTPDEIGEAGNITTISYFNASVTQTRSYDIYMVHTDKSTFTGSTDWITVTEADRVYSGSVTITKGYWTTIVLDTPFAYNGTSNLAIIVDDNTGTWSSSMACRVYNANGNQAIRVYSDPTNYDPFNPSGYSGTRYSVKNQIILGMETEIEQTIALSAGWNWISANVEITLEDLEDALITAYPNTGVNSLIIKSNGSGQTAWNPAAQRWIGGLNTIDLTQMYMVKVATAGEIILEGMPINPAEHPITIHNGANWIAFPFSENMTVSNAFVGFAVAGDVVKSKNDGIATYNGTNWRGTLNTLEPGQGYIYKSNVQGDRTFTFPTGTK